MALITIIVHDNEGDAQVNVIAEPMLPQAGEQLTPAQGAALTMLKALENSIKQDKGLIQLLN